MDFNNNGTSHTKVPKLDVSVFNISFFLFSVYFFPYYSYFIVFLVLTFHV